MPDLAKAAVADAVNKQQMFRAAERTVFLAKLDDIGGELFTDMRDPLQFGGVGRVDVYSFHMKLAYGFACDRNDGITTRTGNRGE